MEMLKLPTVTYKSYFSLFQIVCKINYAVSIVWLLVLMLAFPFMKVQNDVKTLAYWLSNLSALTVLLQRSFKTTRTALSTPQRRRFSSERIFHTSQTSNAGLSYLGQSVVGATGLPQVEAKYPALLFKQQLVDLIEKVYGMISDCVKKELNPLLELCIQVLLTANF
jgi:hypothetical protein